MTETPARPSLYDRLGGVYNIAPVVDDLIDRVMKDQRLNANPRLDEAHHRVSAAGFKYFVTEMLCEAAVGPQHYSGRPMGDSHRHLMITWAAKTSRSQALAQASSERETSAERNSRVRRTLKSARRGSEKEKRNASQVLSHLCHSGWFVLSSTR